MLGKQEIDELIREFAPMGFDPNDILMAWLQSNKRKAVTLDILLTNAYNFVGEEYILEKKTS